MPTEEMKTQVLALDNSFKALWREAAELVVEEWPLSLRPVVQELRVNALLALMMNHAVDIPGRLQRGESPPPGWLEDMTKTYEAELAAWLELKGRRYLSS